MWWFISDCATDGSLLFQFGNDEKTSERSYMMYSIISSTVYIHFIISLHVVSDNNSVCGG